MADTKRTLEELIEIFKDNINGDISPQDIRDLIVSTFDNFGTEEGTFCEGNDRRLVGQATQKVWKGIIYLSDPGGVQHELENTFAGDAVLEYLGVVEADDPDNWLGPRYHKYDLSFPDDTVGTYPDEFTSRNTYVQGSINNPRTATGYWAVFKPKLSSIEIWTSSSPVYLSVEIVQPGEF